MRVPSNRATLWRCVPGPGRRRSPARSRRRRSSSRARRATGAARPTPPSAPTQARLHRRAASRVPARTTRAERWRTAAAAHSIVDGAAARRATPPRPRNVSTTAAFAALERARAPAPRAGKSRTGAPATFSFVAPVPPATPALRTQATRARARRELRSTAGHKTLVFRYLALRARRSTSARKSTRSARAA